MVRSPPSGAPRSSTEWSGRLGETVSTLKKTSRRIGIRVPTQDNVSKQVAKVASKGEPCIYATSVTKSIAKRFKTCLNENAKMHATFDSAPDFLHNEVEAWELPDRRLHPIFLQRKNDPAFETKSLEAFVDMLTWRGVKTKKVLATGAGNLAQPDEPVLHPRRGFVLHRDPEGRRPLRHRAHRHAEEG